MMMWKRLRTLCCLRAETLQGLKGKWGIHQEGMGGGFWVNATQTHISASLGKDLASTPSGKVLGHPLEGFGRITVCMDEPWWDTEV